MSDADEAARGMMCRGPLVRRPHLRRGSKAISQSEIPQWPAPVAVGQYTGETAIDVEAARMNDVAIRNADAHSSVVYLARPENCGLYSVFSVLWGRRWSCSVCGCAVGAFGKDAAGLCAGQHVHRHVPSC